MSGIYMDRDKLKAEIKAEEGLSLKPYRCTAGKLTIGWGRNLEDRGITETEADYLLANDIDSVAAELQHSIPWFKYCPDPVQRALCNMAFQMGVAGLLGFRKMLEAINHQDYRKAADEALDSRWAQQTPARAQRVAALIRSA